MVDRHGRVTDTSQSDLAMLLREILQQQTAMLQVQAESVRLQRVLVERLLGVSDAPAHAVETHLVAPPTATNNVVVGPVAPTPSPAASLVPSALATNEAAPAEITPLESVPDPPAESTSSDLPFAPAPVEQSPARGARYYQPRPSTAPRSVAPEELELLRRLQEMRDASV